MKNWRMTIAALLGAAVLASCGASGGDGETAGEETSGAEESTEVESAAGDAAFGTLEDVCGDGSFTVEADQQGLSNGMLNIGVATDREAEARPGLNKETWDSSVAFAQWCNARGGIGGLEINLVELSGGLFNVEAAMITACTDVFAMVGGGFVQDQLMFSGNDGSDFHRCDLVDVPAFAVSAQKSGSNGLVQPIPNSEAYEQLAPMRAFKEQYPDDAESAVVVYGDLPTMETTSDKRIHSLEEVGIDVTGTVVYPVLGANDWTPYAREVIQSGATMMFWIGEPANGANLLASLDQQGWEGRALLDTNMYGDATFSQGDAGPEGSAIWLVTHTLEEADEWPGIRTYLDVLEQYVPDYATSPLGMASMSAWLLFATAANECGEANDGVLDRTCILEQAAAQEDWTGGGIHSPTDPAPGESAGPTSCGFLVEIRGGEFVRVSPEIGGEDDDIEGFRCWEDGVAPVDGAEPGVVDPDRPI